MADDNQQFDPQPKSSMPRAVRIVLVLAFVTVAQALIRSSLTPYDPNQGEGNYRTVEAAFYLWLSLGVSLVLIAYAIYLMKRRKTD